MKLLIFSISISICILQIFSQTIVTYVATANDLSKRLKSALDNITSIQINVKNQLNGVPTLKLDYTGNYKIVYLQGKINKNAGKPNIQNCQKLLNDKMEALRAFMRNYSKNELNNQAGKLTNYEKTLRRIQPRLSGDSLAQEVGECQKSPRQCKLTGEYTRNVTDTETFIKDNSKYLLSSDLAYRVIERYGVAEFANQVDSIAAYPVQDCLKPY